MKYYTVLGPLITSKDGFLIGCNKTSIREQLYSRARMARQDDTVVLLRTPIFHAQNHFRIAAGMF